MSLDNFNHSTPDNSDLGHSGEGGSTLHDGTESPEPGDDQGDGHPSPAIENEEVHSHEEATTPQSVNPLHLLIEENDEDEDACKSIEETAQWKGMVNDPSPDESNETPLHIAARKGFVETAQLLLKAGANVNAKDDSGMQPLHKACKAKCDELVKALCGRKDLTAEKDDDGWYPIHFASWEGLKKKTVQLLLGPDNKHLNTVESGTNWTPLNMAAWRGNDEVVSTLLGVGADHTIVDSDGWTPLIAAVKMRHFTTFDLLLDHLKSKGRRDVIDLQDNQGMTAFMELCEAADEEDAPLSKIQASLAKIREFDSTFAIADKNGKTVLHHAMGSAVSVEDPEVMLKMLLWAKDETILLEDNNHKTAFGVAFDMLKEQEDVELSETPSPTSVHEVNPDIMPVGTVDRLKNNKRLRDFLLCWLAQHVEMHQYAIKIMAEVPVILGKAETDRLQVEKWGLVEWTIFRRIPHVLLSYVLASKRLGSDFDRHISKDTRESRQKLIESLEKEAEKEALEEAENKKASTRSPTAAREKGKKTDDRVVDSGGKNEGQILHGSGQVLQDIKDILDIYLVETPTSPGNLVQSTPTEDMGGSMRKLNAAVISMRQDDRKFTTFVKTRSIEEVVYKKPLETFEDTIQRLEKLLPRSKDSAESTGQSANAFGAGFTWVHFPSTNMIWMRDTMKKIVVQSDCSVDEQHTLDSFLQTSWVQIPDSTSTARFMRPLYVRRSAGEADLNRGRSKWPIDEGNSNKNTNGTLTDHGDQTKRSTDETSLSRSATPASSSHEKKTRYDDSSALYMPFLSFSNFKKEQQGRGQNLATVGTAAEENPAHLHGVPVSVAEQRSTRKPMLACAGRNAQGRTPDELPGPSLVTSASLSVHEELFKAYHGEAIHCSPTLDEFYYQFASDPESRNDQYFRNQGQTVTTYLHKNLNRLDDSWTLLRVNQLWIWVLGDKWMISATSCMDSNADNRFVLDILAHLRKRADCGNKRGPKSPEELRKLIVEYCIGNFENKYSFDCRGHKQEKDIQHDGLGSGAEKRTKPSQSTDFKTQDAKFQGAKSQDTKHSQDTKSQDTKSQDTKSQDTKSQGANPRVLDQLPLRGTGRAQPRAVHDVVEVVPRDTVRVRPAGPLKLGTEVAPLNLVGAKEIDSKGNDAKINERSIHQVFSDSINRIGREEAALFSKFLHKPKRDVVKDAEDSQSKTGGSGLGLNRFLRFLSKKNSSTSIKSIQGNEDSHGARTGPLTTELLQEATQQAAQLLFDIKDVRDELNIMKTVAQFQLKVQSAMKRHEGERQVNVDPWANCQDPKASSEDLAAEYVCNDIKEMDKVAEQIQESVRTTISLQESEIANLQAIEGVNEAKRMTVFTITSIVFLPLSFLSSLFALDVSSFLDAPTWSLVVIFTVPLPFLIWAADYVYRPWRSTSRGPKTPRASRPPPKSNDSDAPQQKGDQNV